MRFKSENKQQIVYDVQTPKSFLRKSIRTNSDYRLLNTRVLGKNPFSWYIFVLYMISTTTTSHTININHHFKIERIYWVTKTFPKMVNKEKKINPNFIILRILIKCVAQKMLHRTTLHQSFYIYIFLIND